MGVTMEAAWPTSVATRDSLELSVFRNMVLNSQNTNNAMTIPAKAETGFGLEDPLPLSLNPYATLLQGLELWPAATLFFLLVYSLKTRNQIQRLVIAKEIQQGN